MTGRQPHDLVLGQYDQDLIATSRPRAVRLTPPYVRGHPPSLERPPANRPWRIVALN